MADLDAAVATQLANIQKRTGRSLDELTAIVRESGLTKHGELVAMLKTTLGMGHGDANMLVHTVKNGGTPSPAPAAGGDVLEALYAGPKAALRPIHDRLVAELRTFGTFDEAPKKTYVSYRRNRQFAMIGPATKSQVEVGINMKGMAPTDRLQELPAGGMCSHRVRISSADDVDTELIGWIRAAYDAAG